MTVLVSSAISRKFALRSVESSDSARDFPSQKGLVRAERDSFPPVFPQSSTKVPMLPKSDPPPIRDGIVLVAEVTQSTYENANPPAENVGRLSVYAYVDGLLHGVHDLWTGPLPPQSAPGRHYFAIPAPRPQSAV